MLFNSLAFLVFFPVVTISYFLLPYRFRTVLLLIASCIFYAAFVPGYLLILFFLISVDYWAGMAIERTEGKARFRMLLMSILANGGVLFFFKYFDFINDNLSFLFHTVGLGLTLPHLDLLLPIGLSFHVFQSLSYTIEVYRKRVPAEQNFLIFALYVIFYPQLVAGPIERPQRLLPELHKNYDFEEGRVISGLQLMAWGLFKKVVIADQAGYLVDFVYDKPTEFAGPTLVIATVLFAYQLYCDFSGYTDIARGAARVMGIELTRNFNFPYSATTVTEFWHRWHISLSSWIRDYIFMPLAVKWRHWGVLGISLALLVSFFFSGLWHGASWMFVIWGLLNGVMLVFEFLTGNIRKKLVARLPKWVSLYGGRTYVFLFWCISLVFFRSHSLTQAFFILRQSVHEWVPFLSHVLDRSYQEKYLPLGGHRKAYLILMCSIAALLIVQGLAKRFPLRAKFGALPIGLRWLAYSVCLWAILFGGVFVDRQFIYFAF